MQTLKYGPRRRAAATFVAGIDDREIDPGVIRGQDSFGRAVLQRDAPDAQPIEFEELRETLPSEQSLLIE
jgi:hypothetical protein